MNCRGTVVFAGRAGCNRCAVTRPVEVEVLPNGSLRPDLDSVNLFYGSDRYLYCASCYGKEAECSQCGVRRVLEEDGTWATCCGYAWCHHPVDAECGCTGDRRHAVWARLAR